MDEVANLPKVDINWLKKLKDLATNPLTVATVAKDDVWLGCFTMIMGKEDEAMVTLSLEILTLLAGHKEYRPRMKGYFGMMQQLQDLLNNPQTPGAIYMLADEVHKLLLEAPNLEPLQDIKDTSTNQPNLEPLQDIKDTATNQPNHEPLQDIKDASTNQPKTAMKTGQKTRRRNSMLVQGKSGKTITLQIRGMVNRDDMDLCRSLLVKVKGVISITFDFKKKRSILRCRNDLKPEVLVQAITRSITMTADQVVKDEQGEEVLVSFGSKLSLARGNKENEDMPDYPPDDDSPVRGDKSLARMGEAEDSPAGWGFIKSVGSFIATSLYW